jgi:hypothetical protein
MDPERPGGPGPEEDRDWVEVRESWVGDRPSEPRQYPPPLFTGVEPPRIDELPPSRRPQSFPPPLPSSRAPPVGVMPHEESERRPDAIGRMLERLAASDHDGALRAAEALLRHDPGCMDAVQCREMSRAELRKIYVARLGDTARVPRIAVGAAALRAIDVDVRTGLVLSRVDGKSTIDAVSISAVVTQLDSLRILSELYLSGIITLDP